MNISSGNDLLKTIGNFIREHNDVFYTIIFLLYVCCGLVWFIQFCLRNSMENVRLSDKEKLQQCETERINKRCENISQSISKYDKDLAISDSRAIAKIEQCSTMTLCTLREIKIAYDHNLIYYHQNNSKIYKIVRNTHLSCTHSIAGLIDTYTQLNI